MQNGFEKESAKVKENQVEILSDPVTVSRECQLQKCHCAKRMRRRGCREDLRVRKPAGKVSESLPMKAYIHGKMYEAKSDICFFVAMRPKKSFGGETLLQKKQMSVCLFAEKMCPQKQDYLQGDIIDGDRHRPAA